MQSSISAFRSTCLARTAVQCPVIMLPTRYLKSQWQYCWDCSVCWGSFLCELCACIPFLWELYLQLSMQQLCEVFQKTLHSVVLSTLTILLRLIMNSVQLPRCEAWMSIIFCDTSLEIVHKKLLRGYGNNYCALETETHFSPLFVLPFFHIGDCWWWCRSYSLLFIVCWTALWHPTVYSIV